MKRMMALLTAVAISTVSFATPTISDLKVTPISPLGLAIDYNVSGAKANDASLLIDVSLVSGMTTNVATVLAGATNCVNGAHRVYWDMARQGLSMALTNADVSVRYAVPRYCVVDLSQGANTNSYPVSYYVREPDGGFTNEVYKTTKLVLKRIEAGSFVMGENQTDESHRVTLTKPFYVGLYEITQRQWTQVMGTDPGFSSNYGKGDPYPAYYVSYDMIRGSSDGTKWPATNAVDGTSFMGKLRERTKLVFDLPTNVQWEYACRAGTMTTYGYGDDADGDYMWYAGNSSGTSHEVGTRKPNDWGLYDLHGNAWEFCRDWSGTLAYGENPLGADSGTARVIRGGGYDHSAGHAASYFASGCPASGRNNLYGFRVESGVPVAHEQFVDVPETVGGVDVSVIADGSSFVARDIEIGYAPVGSANAVVTVDGSPVVDSAEAGTCLWQPREPQTYVLKHTVGDISLTATYDVKARPVVLSDLKVTPIEPLGLAIDYTISEATSRDLTRPIDVTMTVGDKNYIAKTLLGETKCENGLHRVYWNMAKDGLSIDAKDAVVTVTYYQGDGSQYCVIDLSQGTNASSYSVSYYVRKPDDGFTNEVYKTTKLVLRRVEAGSFIMGENQTDESHRVTLTKPFYVGLYEITQRQWTQVMGTDPGFSSTHGKGDSHPAYNVSYDMIRGSSNGAKWPATNSVDMTSSFLGKLRSRTKQDFDLPTEAQWEYTCRAGTTTTFYYGKSEDGAYMWYCDNSSNSAHVVGTKLPNKWGFYDMHGNVWEWCLDKWSAYSSYGVDPKGPTSGNGRVVRGEYWGALAYSCESSARTGLISSYEGYLYGFRLCRTLVGSDVESQNALVATAAGVSCHVIADGAEVDGSLTIGTAPTRTANAVATVDGETVLTASEATTVVWKARTFGSHTITHSVGDISMSATYNVTALVDPVPAVAADGDVAAALDGAADARLAEKLIDATKYTAYRTWVDGVAGTDLADAAVVAKRQAIKDAAHAWLGYVLDLGYDAAVTLGPKQGDLMIATFENGAVAGGTATLPSGTSGDDAWTLTVSLDGISVGANATAANLAEAFVVEGATSLGDAAFSSSSVTATFSPTSDGKVSISIKPTDASVSTFFIRVKLTP